MNLRPLGYEDRGALFNPEQHLALTGDMFRQSQP
jgi:hypothetical protein